MVAPESKTFPLGHQKQVRSSHTSASTSGRATEELEYISQDVQRCRQCKAKILEYNQECQNRKKCMILKMYFPLKEVTKKSSSMRSQCHDGTDDIDRKKTIGGRKMPEV